MAKTRKTTSERLVTECFIEVRGKTSFGTSVGPNNGDDEDSEASASSNIAAAIPSTIKTAADQTSEISNISGIREESLEVTDDSDSSQSPRTNDPEDEDKSDYEAESFCSDDSCKGSEVTNVTPRSSLSGCSSLLRSAGLKYDKRITDLIKSRRSGDRRREDEDSEERLSLSESEMKYLSEEEGTLTMDRRQLTRSGRRNMSFTNEELRKIERENELLLKKIMSHQKPQNKSVKPVSGAPRTSSSAINRKRQQKKIEEDNMILLRRIQRAKPCAMPRASAPGCKLATM